MKIRSRALAVVSTSLLFASICLGAAVVPGFNTISDGRNDDGTYTLGGCNNPAPGGTCDGTLVPIGFDVNFFGSTYDSLYINTNGNVTFNAPLPSFDPFPLVDGFAQIIAPFFADVDTRNPASGVVMFGNGTFDGHNALGVDWIDVGYFDQEVDKTNSFQLLLVDRSDTGAGNFDIVFNYDRIEWETGDGSFGVDGLGGFSARAGFSDGSGDPANSFELPGSGVPGSFIDGGTIALTEHSLNSDVLGRYIFTARNGTVSTSPNEVPEPATSILLGGAFALLVVRRSRR